MSEQFTIKQALISVSDKNNLQELAYGLQNYNIHILASGGTAKLLKENNIDNCEVADYTKQDEILDGRVKTLHPKIFGGILSRDNNPKDITELKNNNINKINLVIVNLYPFEQKLNELLISKNNSNNFTIDSSSRGLHPRTQDGTTTNNLKNLDINDLNTIEDLDHLIEFIDIGGPSLIRAAAKNYKHCLVITNHKDYQWLLNKLKTNSEITVLERLEFANKAFTYTAAYEQVISKVLTTFVNKTSSNNKNSNITQNQDYFPDELNLNLNKVSELRYGENPNQQAAVYRYNSNNISSKLASPELLQGKALSYNNLLDSNCAINIIKSLAQCTSLNNTANCAIIKHATPCGVATTNSNIVEAYHKAYNADNRSAFGGIIAINKTLTAELADNIISNQFLEVLICPDIEKSALDIFKTKPNVRLIKYNFNSNIHNSQPNLQVRTIDGGILMQSALSVENLDNTSENSSGFFEVVTDNKNLSEKILQDLKFSWYIVQNVKSNAIVLVNNLQTIGIGGGQTSRVGSVELAAHLAKTMNHNMENCVMASDAFFPFPDSIELAKKLGVQAIIQPGGSKNDPLVIAKANEKGIIMVFTHKRKFCH